MGKLARMLLIPVLAGLVASIAVYATFGQKEAQPAELDLVPVLAARAEVPARTPLTAAMFEVRQVPRELAAGVAADVTQVEGRLLDAPMLAGELLLEAKLVDPEKASMTYQVAAGKRAVTIPANEHSGVGGYPNPGDYVDVLLVLPEKKEEGGRITATENSITAETNGRPASARLLLEKVRVLARGPARDAAQAEAVGGSQGLTSFTIEITPDQAVELALAEELGHFKLALRPAVEDSEAPVGEVVVQESRFAVKAK